MSKFISLTWVDAGKEKISMINADQIFMIVPKEYQLTKNKPKTIIVSSADKPFEVMESVEEILERIEKS